MRSVFDAFSLGVWIYGWTFFHHGKASPMADLAADLWLLLIKLAGIIKHADEVAPLARNLRVRDILEGLLEAGERLWGQLKKLIKACEVHIWKSFKKNGLTLDHRSCCAFVDAIFGRDHELEVTEKLMRSMRLWILHFDAIWSEIPRQPELR
jgi:hypothetical protein